MSARRIGKILLYGIAGSLVAVLALMLAVKLALDSAPRNQAEIKQWVHERIGYNIAFVDVSPAFRWYGPELYFDQMELRSRDNQRVLARARAVESAPIFGSSSGAESCSPCESNSTHPTSSSHA